MTERTSPTTSVRTAARLRVIRGSSAATLWLALLLAPRPAAACSCVQVPLEQAFTRAALVAEVELVDLVPPRDPDDDMGTQTLRYRVVRVFSGPRSVADGDFVTVTHQQCNSMPYDRSAIGGRAIVFFSSWQGVLHQQHCSATASAWEPLPALLVQARRRWLEQRR